MVTLVSGHFVSPVKEKEEEEDVVLSVVPVGRRRRPVEPTDRRSGTDPTLGEVGVSETHFCDPRPCPNPTCSLTVPTFVGAPWTPARPDLTREVRDTESKG